MSFVFTTTALTSVVLTSIFSARPQKVLSPHLHSSSIIVQETK